MATERLHSAHSLPGVPSMLTEVGDRMARRKPKASVRGATSERLVPRFRGRGVSGLALLAAIAVSPSAGAQRWVLDGNVGLGSGAEGADLGNGVSWQRARVRLNAGVDLSVDEDESQAWRIGAFVELERSVSVGAEARYIAWLSPRFGAYAGPVAVLTPATLFGGEVGATYLIPLDPRKSIYVDASFAALPLGSDRPGDGTVLWALLGSGIRVRF